MTKNLNCPEKIYLQVQDDNELATWCEDRTNEDDIEYIRADLVNTRPDPLQEKVEEFSKIINHPDAYMNISYRVREEFNRIFGESVNGE